MSIKEYINCHYRLKKICASLEGQLDASRVFRAFHFRQARRKIAKLQQVGLPSCVHVETTNQCNARCLMCPQSSLTRHTGHMPIKVFQKIIDNVQEEGIQKIGLSFLGEPLLDPSFVERLAYVRKKSPGSFIFFSTNASLLTDAVAQGLIDHKVNEIRISFDAFTKGTYEHIRRGLCYETVISNILRFVDRKRKQKVPYPKLRLTFVALTHNEREIQQFYAFWRRRVDTVEVDFARNWAEQYQVPDQGSVHTRPHRASNPCDVLWKEMVITVDGQAVLCCNDYDGTVIMGDVVRDGIRAVWNSDAYRTYRTQHAAGNRSALKLCNTCMKYSWWL